MSRCSVVVADDAPDIRALIRTVLEVEDDIEVVGEAVDGVEAVEVVAKAQPDVVLLDLSMPRMDGLEAIPQIRDASPATAIVVLSGFLNDDVKQRVLGLGATSCIEKGLKIDMLTGAVRDAWAAGSRSASSPDPD